MFRCDHCAKTYTSQAYFEAHVASGVCRHRKEKRYKCDKCAATFKKRNTYTQHMNRFHKFPSNKPCPRCPKIFYTVKALTEHMKTHVNSTKFELVMQANEGVLRTYRMEFWEEVPMLNEAFIQSKRDIMDQLNLIRMEHSSFKVNIVFLVSMIQNLVGEEDRRILFPFRTKYLQILPFDDLNDHVHEAFSQIEEKVEDFKENGSGFTVDDIMSCSLEIALSKPLQGYCSFHNVCFKITDSVKKVFIEDNPDTGHDKLSCFFLAISRYFLAEDFSSDRAYELTKEMWDISKAKSPMKVQDIKLFEERNESFDLSVNVIYKDHNEEYFPVYASKRNKAKNVINLLLFYVEENEEVILHYAWIEDIGKMFPYMSKNFRKKSHPCLNCFNFFSTKKALLSHQSFCLENRSVIVELPSEDQKIEYKVGAGEVYADYVAYVDFETLSAGVDECSCTKKPVGKKRKPCRHNTKLLAEMKPFSYCLIVLDGNDKVCEHVVYSGEDAGVHCLKTLLHFGEKYKKLMDRIAPLRMDQKDILHYEQSENCYLCLKPLLVNGKLDKCIDHSHSMFTKGSNYLGPSHAKCNLARRVKKDLYVFSHNYSGFESHIFMNPTRQRRAQLQVKMLSVR